MVIIWLMILIFCYIVLYRVFGLFSTIIGCIGMCFIAYAIATANSGALALGFILMLIWFVMICDKINRPETIKKQYDQQVRYEEEYGIIDYFDK